MSWKLDMSHSEVSFTVSHMMITKVRGQFEKFEVEAELDQDHPEQASIEARIAAVSINTRDPQRDGHLKSPDFLNTAQYPTLVFKSTLVEPLGDGRARMTGNLTIQAITRPVVMDVVYAGSAKSPWGASSAGFEATTSISRKEWGLTWNVALETGGWLVGDQIDIGIQLELVKQEEPVGEPA